jgi:hypothetical protein
MEKSDLFQQASVPEIISIFEPKYCNFFEEQLLCTYAELLTAQEELEYQFTFDFYFTVIIFFSSLLFILELFNFTNIYVSN